ncbi:hypothetical protein, partial [Listeria monocytogenes]|uniref:hypothetical protein n=1 Tax=Listeria monocytogenes TaxID=1639 RepID=UPI001C3FF875
LSIIKITRNFDNIFTNTSKKINSTKLKISDVITPSIVKNGTGQLTYSTVYWFLRNSLFHWRNYSLIVL